MPMPPASSRLRCAGTRAKRLRGGRCGSAGPRPARRERRWSRRVIAGRAARRSGSGGSRRGRCTASTGAAGRDALRHRRARRRRTVAGRRRRRGPGPASRRLARRRPCGRCAPRRGCRSWGGLRAVQRDGANGGGEPGELHAVPARSRSRMSSRSWSLRTLPEAVRGRLSTSTSFSGCFCRATPEACMHCCTCAKSSGCPGRVTT